MESALAGWLSGGWLSGVEHESISCLAFAMSHREQCRCRNGHLWISKRILRQNRYSTRSQHSKLASSNRKDVLRYLLQLDHKFITNFLHNSAS